MLKTPIGLGWPKIEDILRFPRGEPQETIFKRYAKTIFWVSSRCEIWRKGLDALYFHNTSVDSCLNEAFPMPMYCDCRKSGETALTNAHPLVCYLYHSFLLSSHSLWCELWWWGTNEETQWLCIQCSAFDHMWVCYSHMFNPFHPLHTLLAFCYMYCMYLWGVGYKVKN